ncbi:MAG: DUF2269 family protein [Actinomycetota bacterium]
MVAAWSWYGFWLALHILLVMTAFGPNIVMVPVVATMGQKHPQYGAFAAEVIHVFESKLATPLAVLVPLTGVGLIYTSPTIGNFWKTGWLLASILIFIVAFFFAITVQTRNAARFVEVLRSMPPGPPPEGAQPPPEVAALGKKLMRGGQFLTLALVVLLVLMVGGREGWFGYH